MNCSTKDCQRVPTVSPVLIIDRIGGGNPAQLRNSNVYCSECSSAMTIGDVFTAEIRAEVEAKTNEVAARFGHSSFDFDSIRLEWSPLLDVREDRTETSLYAEALDRARIDSLRSEEPGSSYNEFRALASVALAILNREVAKRTWDLDEDRPETILGNELFDLPIASSKRCEVLVQWIHSRFLGVMERLAEMHNSLDRDFSGASLEKLLSQTPERAILVFIGTTEALVLRNVLRILAERAS